MMPGKQRLSNRERLSSRRTLGNLETRVSEHENDEAVEFPIDGTLDLHTFSPKDLKYLIPDYLDACREKGILEVRIVHGKGTGTLRRTVHAVLEKTPGVASFKLAGEDRGSWGATLVKLEE